MIDTDDLRTDAALLAWLTDLDRDRAALDQAAADVGAALITTAVLDEDDRDDAD